MESGIMNRVNSFIARMILNSKDKGLFNIKLNLGYILLFVFFWTYGLYGFFVTEGLPKNFLISVIFTMFFLVLLFYSDRIEEFKSSFSIKKYSVFIFFSYFLVMLFFTRDLLMQSLTGDQIYHANRSQMHVVTLLRKVSLFTTIFDNIPLKYISYICTLLIISIIAIFFNLLKGKNKFLKLFILAFMFLGIRISVVFLGFTEGHPPFRLFPLWVASSIFPMSDFIFRFSQFILLIILMTFMQIKINEKLSSVTSWFFALAIGTIPVLFYTSSIVEPSIWTTFLLTILLIKLDNIESKDNLKWFSVIGIFSLMRSTAIIGLLIIVLKLFYEVILEIKIKKVIKIRKYLTYLFPFLVFMPYIVITLINGTPATYIPGEVEFIPTDASAIERVFIAFKEGIMIEVIKNSISSMWLIFLLFAFIPTNRYKRINSVFIFISFIFGLYLFYSIKASLWGNGRYQAEYIIPFVILGFYNAIIVLKEKTNENKFVFISFFVGMICYNHYFYTKTIENYNEEKSFIVNNDYIKTSIISDGIYNYKEALYEAKKSGYSENLYICGITYGIFEQIVNGYTLREINKLSEISKEMNMWNPSILDAKEVANIISNNQNVEMVLLSETLKKKEIESELKKMGWKNWKNFRDNKWRTDIIGLIKD